MSFQVHTIETAPKKSVEILETAVAKYGFLPNLMGIFAESPAILEAYLKVGEIVDQTTLSPLERQIVFIGASISNDCHYCVAAHSVISAMQNLPGDVINALRENRPIADAKLEAFRKFVLTATEQRGFVSDEETKSFLDAGYTKENILEVILIIGMKVLSNYTNHFAETPLDAAFETAKWQKATA